METNVLQVGSGYCSNTILVCYRFDYVLDALKWPVHMTAPAFCEICDVYAAGLWCPCRETKKQTRVTNELQTLYSILIEKQGKQLKYFTSSKPFSTLTLLVPHYIHHVENMKKINKQSKYIVALKECKFILFLRA